MLEQYHRNPPPEWLGNLSWISATARREQGLTELQFSVAVCGLVSSEIHHRLSLSRRISCYPVTKREIQSLWIRCILVWQSFPGGKKDQKFD